MNKYYYDSVLRMSVEMSLFMIPGGFTISEAAELLKLDKSIVREDVYNLFTFDAIRDLLNIAVDSDCLDSLYGNDYFEDVFLDEYDVEEDIKCDREMQENGEFDEELDDDIKLFRYWTGYVNLSDLQDELKNRDEAHDDYSDMNDYAFDKFKYICRILPNEFDPDKCWKADFISQLSEATEDEDWEKIIKSIENAKIRILRRIKGTTESGARKGIHKDGEKYGLLSGLYDDSKFLIDAIYLDYDNDIGEYMLVLSSEEYTHLNEFLSKQGTPLHKMDGIFKVKNSLDIIQRESVLKYDILDKIRDGAGIKFEYTNKKTGVTDWVKIKPKWINYNSDTGFMYIVDSDDYKYKVDRIKGLKIYDLQKGEEVDKKPKLKKEWVNVVIHIPKIEGYDNLINKIKDDVRRRNMDPSYNVDEHFSEEDDKYIYKDRIEKGEIGSFKSWIYSYGSSFVVMKPNDLRQQIIDSYKARAEYYI